MRPRFQAWLALAGGRGLEGERGRPPPPAAGIRDSSPGHTARTTPCSGLRLRSINPGGPLPWELLPASPIRPPRAAPPVV